MTDYTILARYVTAGRSVNLALRRGNRDCGPTLTFLTLGRPVSEDDLRTYLADLLKDALPPATAATHLQHLKTAAFKWLSLPPWMAVAKEITS